MIVPGPVLLINTRATCILWTMNKTQPICGVFSDGDFDEFASHLEGLIAMYRINADK